MGCTHMCQPLVHMPSVQKLKACWRHTYDESVLLDGLLQRYCQQVRQTLCRRRGLAAQHMHWSGRHCMHVPACPVLAATVGGNVPAAGCGSITTAAHDTTAHYLLPLLLRMQCNSFHTLEHFEGIQRSCRWQLERRRQRRRVATLASNTPESEEPPTQSRRPRRAAALQHRHLGAAADDEAEDPPAPVDRPPKRQRLAPPAAGGPPAQWLAPGGAEQHPAYAGRWEVITDPALVQAIYAAVAANHQPQPAAAAQQPQPAAAWHPNSASLLSGLLRLSGSRGQQPPAQQPVSQPPPLAFYGSPAPPQPSSRLSESEREAMVEQLGRNMTRLMTEQRKRFGLPPPGSMRLPPHLPPPAYGPGGLPPLALELERKPSMTKEEAEAQLATAAVVMALALKCELAAAERQQQA